MLIEETRLVAAPRLESDRLILRAHAPSDFEAHCALWSHPDVVRHISGKPSKRSETWNRMLNYAGHWSMCGFGYWGVFEKETGALVGDVGFADFKRDIEPSLNGFAEAGWVLSPKFHGRGYAREAVETALGWMKQARLFKDVHCIIAPENKASIRLATRLGFEEYTRGSYKELPTVFMKRSLS